MVTMRFPLHTMGKKFGTRENNCISISSHFSSLLYIFTVREKGTIFVSKGVCCKSGKLRCSRMGVYCMKNQDSEFQVNQCFHFFLCKMEVIIPNTQRINWNSTCLSMKWLRASVWNKHSNSAGVGCPATCRAFRWN